MPEKNKSRIISFFIKAVILALLSAMVLVIVALLYNNVSLSSDNTFSSSVNSAINKTSEWIKDHEKEIFSKTVNVALLKMLQDCDQMSGKPVFAKHISQFMKRPLRPTCWKALIDPNWSVNKLELNNTINREAIDNKWILYAIASEKALKTPEQLGLLDHDRWQRRQLTHQLWALVHLYERKQKTDAANKLIEYLSQRLTKELFFDLAVVDIYIQKNAFVLKAGFPEKIRRRWIERVIENQQLDGGFNDRWFCFTSRRRPILNTKPVPSDQHATIQALWLLYQVKYRYPEHFGIVNIQPKKPEKGAH